MISENILKDLAEQAKKQAENTGVPSVFHVTYINDIGQRLAVKLHARPDIVYLGTNLMDFMVGVAVREGRVKEHRDMGVKEAANILSKYPDLDPVDKDKIMWCIRDHHGAKKFHSLESEICCNADCYKFLSIKGVIGGLHANQDRNLEEVVKIYREKIKEKHDALSLDICKKELKKQYKIIRKLFKKFQD
jgi:hypothetical protein